MNQHLGRVVSALIIDENQSHYFAQLDGLTYRVEKGANRESLGLGKMVRGFAYENQKGQAVISENLPAIRQGRYGLATVTKVRKDLGVFVDIGLPDKEIVVSLDDLPSETSLWPKKGDQLMISLKVDKKDRIWGHLADDGLIAQLASPLPAGSRKFQNEEVEGFVYHAKLVGSYVLTKEYHLAFIHESERDIEPRLGQAVKGRVIGVGQNGNLNLSLRPRAFEMISDDAAMILALLERQPNHYLPYHDKSDPDDIRAYFNISKAQFKRAVGNLLKNKKIDLKDQGIALKESKE
ncbi:S1 RNA-binding domain-containing protein [Aerococcus kribbianus]|uniref:S1-like domain-containing RNA-binding protein n=1 Tax=Aerococcus kribbianus TaxID=2999064 RepID=A0A9X3JGV4_9LACT|nr:MULTISPECIES: S1-like domain-containing RNA-binding protein [unclassified Aerococcus]MCZ0717666.1 S1-like domain-containing RNA-binding protein [Aerococcus sp. YH-aer221]MCZ0725954.1 S1-like domain-containing RNA-binding protein [Aerococcus sp. YH-aer222]